MTTPEQQPPTAEDASPDAPDAPESAESEQTPSDDALPRVLSAGRPRLVEAVVERDRGWNAGVRVVVERGGVEHTAERQAVGEEAVVLRSVAEATLDALGTLTGDEQGFALVGVKRLLAFDSAVILACVRTSVGPPRKLIGCVPIKDDPVVAVANAVMHAINRIVETMPNATESGLDIGDEDPEGPNSIIDSSD